ncbi:MAG: hypothetical protein HY814_14295 [Candidatus Riflebacteria bacterium]|nr:hypothetical protein [Candidatus Riflebacteria bacterium]
MPLDANEGFGIALRALEVAKSIGNAIKALPPKEARNAVAYAEAFGAAPGSPLHLTAELIDQAEADIRD